MRVACWCTIGTLGVALMISYVHSNPYPIHIPPISNPQKQHAAAVHQGRTDTARLRRDHAHVTKHLHALQAKSARMEVNESVKVNELWNMKRSMLQGLAGRVKELDGWLVKHVLRVPWGPTRDSCGSQGAGHEDTPIQPPCAADMVETSPCHARRHHINTTMSVTSHHSTTPSTSLAAAASTWHQELHALRAVLSPAQVDVYSTMYKVVQQLRDAQVHRCQLEQQVCQDFLFLHCSN